MESPAQQPPVPALREVLENLLQRAVRNCRSLKQWEVQQDLEPLEVTASALHEALIAIREEILREIHVVTARGTCLRRCVELLNWMDRVSELLWIVSATIRRTLMLIGTLPLRDNDIYPQATLRGTEVLARYYHLQDLERLLAERAARR